MARARQLAADIGVDRLCWEITDHPENAYSRRFVPGSAEFEAIRRETWDDNNLGNAIPGATPRATACSRLERASKTCRHASFPPPRLTVGGWSGSAPSCARRTAS